MSEVKTLKDFVTQAKSQIDEVSIAEITDLLAEGYQVLDVREPAEFNEGTIKGAINVPRGVLEAAADHQVQGREELQDRNKKWLLLCATSGRSAMAAYVMKQMGFTQVKNIDCGMKAYKEADMEVVSPN